MNATNRSLAWVLLSLGGIVVLATWLLIRSEGKSKVEPLQASILEKNLNVSDVEAVPGNTQAERKQGIESPRTTTTNAPQGGVEAKIMLLDGSLLTEGVFEVPETEHTKGGRLVPVTSRGTAMLPPRECWDPSQWKFRTSRGTLEVVSVGVCRSGLSNPIPTVVVTSTLRVRVRVLDEEKQPIGGGQVSIGIRAESLRVLQDVGYEETREVFRHVSGLCDPNGFVEMVGIPDHQSVMVTAKAKGYFARKASLYTIQDQASTFVLVRRQGQTVLSGLVVDFSGVGVSGAQVRFGQDLTSSDLEGRFRMQITSAPPGANLVAYKAGVGCGYLDGEKNDLLRAGGDEADLVVVIRAAELSLSGHAFGEDGKPIAHARIALLGGLSWSPDEAFSCESLLASGDRKPWIESDAEGAFLIASLLPREYRILLIDPETHLCKEFGPYFAGESRLKLLVEPDDFIDVRKGVVKGIGDRPGIGVPVFLRPAHSHLPYFSGLENQYRVISNQEGAFQFQHVPWRFLELECNDAIERVSLRMVLDGADPVIRIEQTCEFVLRGPSALGADSFEILDSSGERKLVMGRTSGGTRSGGKRFYIKADRETQPVCEVGEDAHVIIFYWRDQELSRHKISLTPGLLNRIEL